MTQKIKNDVMDVYKAFWDSYLNGDLETMASFIDDDFQVIGSTEGEIFLNKKETMQFYEATADQVTGKVDFRNRTIKEKLFNGYVSVTEFSDIYIFVEGEWVFYSKFRITSLLEKKEQGWKFIKQHGSIPDTRAEEGEQVASEKIRQENLELRDAIKRRTVELENKNRELEIEAALEKVRAIAMGMREPGDMLDVCKTISLQLQDLGVNEIRNVQTAIFYEHRGTYMNYEYYSKHNKTLITETTYTNNKIHQEFATKMMKGKGEFFNTQITDLKEWLAYQKTTNVFIDTYLEKASSLNYYWFSLGPVAQGISTYVPLADDELTLFKRFLSVFELAYRRFLDIEKAEIQTREARIETSLERIRATAMSMQKADSLLDVVEIIHKELGVLGIPEIRNTSINIFNDDKEKFINYEFSEENGKTVYVVDYNSHISNLHFVNKMREHAKEFLVTDFTGDELEEWKMWIKNQGQKLDAALEKADNLHYYDYSIGLGSIGVSTFCPINNIHLEILNRIRNVFNLAYKRYADISIAEAQAREAQIEAALERVRSRTMAMQKSEDLASTVTIVFSELYELGFKTIRCGIGLFNDKSKRVNVWTASDGDKNDTAQLSGHEILEGHPLLDGIYSAYKKQQDYSYVLQGKDLINYYNVAADSHLPVSGPKSNIKNVTQYYHCVMFPAGGLFAFSDASFNEEAKLLMRRFADVFHLTFIRHLDLMQAEAQAREAQVELALERIRAHVTAMRESSELLDIVVMMQAEFTRLGHEAHYFWHMRWLPDKYEKALTNGEGTRIGNVLELPRGFHGLQAMLDWEKTDEPSAVFALDPETAADYIDKMIKLGRFKEIDHSAPDPDGVRAMGGLTFVMARTTHGEIGYTLPGEVPNPPQEDIATLVRFAGVFDLAYRRFEDLKSSERQNREIQIELALERVRARSMSMYNSEELAETAALLFKQFKLLVNLPDNSRTYISLIDEKSETAEVWMTLPNGQIRPGSHYVPLTSSPQVQRVYNAWKNKEPYIVRDFSGESLNNAVSYLATLPHVKDDKGLQKLIASPPKRLVYVDASFAQGLLGVMTLDPLAEDALEILTRFAHVFEQTYTRFLDLKISEQQNIIIQKENERKTQELEEARKLQLSMLPEEIPDVPNLEIAVYMKTATEVGGDYYDFSFSDDGSLNIAIGDATGHGMKAGIMVSSMKSIFTTNSPKMDIESFFATANSGIKSMGLKQMMMGFTMLNLNSNKIKLINAGLPPVFMFCKKHKTVEEIKEHGIPIGAMKHIQYQTIHGKLERGDVLLLLTDGMPELQNRNKEMYGYERIREGFKNVAEKQPQEIINYLKNEGSDWLNDQDLEDDITFVVIKVK